MRDLTRAEQHELIRLLGLAIANGTAHLVLVLPGDARWQITALVNAATLVRDAMMLDIKNQEG